MRSYHSLVSMISLWAATSSNDLGLYFSIHIAFLSNAFPLPSAIAMLRMIWGSVKELPVLWLSQSLAIVTIPILHCPSQATSRHVPEVQFQVRMQMLIQIQFGIALQTISNDCYGVKCELRSTQLQIEYFNSNSNSDSRSLRKFQDGIGCYELVKCITGRHVCH